MIHPTAVIHAQARLDPTVRVGPYAVIDEAVSVGPNCVIGPHVYLTGHTSIGSNNRFHAGCVIGDAPQDMKYRDEPTRLHIGDENVIREHVTIHRSNNPAEDTVIGSHNLLLAHCHVGHNTRVGDHVVLVNGVLLAGHVTVADRAFLSGNCVVHQFVRVGTLAMLQGGCRIAQDVPPFTLAWDLNRLCGLNVVGLRRAGFSSAERTELKALYRVLFRGKANFRESISAARNQFTSEASRTLLDFVATSRRGVCRHSGAGDAGSDAEE